MSEVSTVLKLVGKVFDLESEVNYQKEAIHNLQEKLNGQDEDALEKFYRNNEVIAKLTKDLESCNREWQELLDKQKAITKQALAEKNVIDGHYQRETELSQNLSKQNAQLRGEIAKLEVELKLMSRAG